MIHYIRSLTLKQRANGIFALTALLYCCVFVGQFFYDGESWYQPLYWAVQSALIGSVADWFAVTALFRKPLGFPYHTALIPRNKERLINGVIQLVKTKMLTKDRCLVLVGNIQFVPLFEQFLLSPEGQRAARLVIHQGLHLLWKSQSSAEWATWGANRIRTLLRKQSLVPALKHVLLDLCEHNRYESMVVQVLGVVQERMNHPAMVTWLTSVVAEEAHRKKRKGFFQDFFISVSEATDVINYKEMAEAIIQEVYAMLETWKRPNSPERTAWLRQWVTPIRNIEDNREVCAALDEAWERWIREQDWESIIENHLCPYVEELLLVGDENGETPAQVLVNIALELWNVYGRSEDLRNRIERTMHDIAQYVLEQGYDLIETIIRQVLGGLSTDKFIYFIESKVEDDLSWIRINGAVVGAVAGLLTWIFLEYVYTPLWAQLIGS
ncbi:DUF445 domain-containing protein [Veillonella sp. AS16]|uniref:DUF445 domain-containing protein n=1 Tax=Veillonella sp. AS16 TaxID=936589 RepID=UPI0003E2898C|nr:DUF445 domain-containing protein [Veillonella sp. AS16]ETS92055.1 PF04286 family protein [Veillonella sp. AS16]